LLFLPFFGFFEWLLLLGFVGFGRLVLLTFVGFGRPLPLRKVQQVQPSTTLPLTDVVRCEWQFFAMVHAA
jgi:hypothetical protein